MEFDRTPSQDLQYEYGNAYSFQQKITALRQPSSKVNNKWQLKTSTWPHHDTENFLLAVTVLIISGTQHTLGAQLYVRAQSLSHALFLALPNETKNPQHLDFHQT